ncbi:MAG TPA: porin [Candidatus Binatia bacterium]|nr:porin [Candidatus Binatia bacterium]
MRKRTWGAMGVFACLFTAAMATADEPEGSGFPVSTPAAEAAAAPAVDACAADGALKVYWKDGLRLDTCDKNFRFKFGGRVFWDATIWNADSEIETAIGDDLRNGTEFRAARLYLSGEIYEYVVFKAEYDFANDAGTDFKDVYIGLQNVVVDGSKILLGNTKAPMGLEQLTSSRFITFMERGLPDAFAPSRETGLHLSAPWLEGRLHTAVAVTQTAENDQFTHTGNDFNVTSRLVGVPYVDGDDRVIHLGISHSYQMFEDNEVRYRQRPEVHQSERFVDTGVFEADDAHTVGAEAAAVFGPFSVQGEYLHNFIDSSVADDPELSGYYVFASWFVTGEHRNYKLGEGAFDRVKVKKNFLTDAGGFGALELAARYSYLDLDNEGATGGELADVTAGVNWHLNPNARLMVNYVHADLDKVSDTDAFIMRTQIDF